MIELLSIGFVVLVVYICAVYYWARVISVAALLVCWAGLPLVGWVYGVSQACKYKIDGACLFQSVGGGAIVAFALGIPWWIAFSHSLKWLKEHPLREYSLLDQV